MDYEKLMEDINYSLHIHDNNVIAVLDKDESDDIGIVIKIVMISMDKFLGLATIAEIIKKVLKNYKITLKGLKLQNGYI